MIEIQNSKPDEFLKSHIHRFVAILAKAGFLYIQSIPDGGLSPA